ncbi:MFS transporter [Cellulomonas sp. Marseille-Q8402]
MPRSGGVAAGVGWGPAPQLVLLAVLAALARGAISLALRRDAQLPIQTVRVDFRGEAGSTPARARRGGVWLETPTLLLGTVVFGAALSEGAANNWMAPLAVAELRVDETRAAMFVSVFLVAQTAGRLIGGPLVDRLGRSATLVTSALVSALGVIAFTTAPAPWVAWAGAAVWGLGAALAVPVAVSIAAGQGRAAERIAAVTSLSSLANVAGPPLIGSAAEFVGLPWAIGAVAVVLVAGAGAGRAVRRFT